MNMTFFKPLLFCIVLFCTNSIFAKEQIRFGVFAYLGYEKTKAEYQPLVDYLNTFLKDEEVVLEVLEQQEINKRLKEDTLDIVTTNPTHYLHIRAEYNIQGVIATLLKESGETYLSQLAGVIIARSDNITVNSLYDVKGKTVSVPSKQHMGGFRSQLYELSQVGINENDFKELYQVVTHQAVVHNVLNNKSQVGFIRDGVLEKMANTEGLDLSKIKVINLQNHPNFPYMVSTKLYPEWPVFALSHTNEKLIRRFAAALFALEPGTIKGIYGYTPSVDYSGIEELSRKLRLPPYDSAPEFSLLDIWYKWNYLVVFFIFSFMLILILVFWLHILLTKVKLEKDFSDSLLGGLGDGVISLDKSFDVVFVNDVAFKLLGYTQKEFESMEDKVILKIKKSCEKREECPIVKTANDKQTRSVDDMFVKKDGSLLPVNYTVASVNGNGVIVIFRDISKVVEYENTLKQQAYELKELNENLEQKIVFEVDKNKKQNELIQQQARLIALGDLIGNIAHHWRQPLSIITGYVGNLQLQAELNGSVEREDIEQAGDKIIETATYLSNTIESFRSLVTHEKPFQNFPIEESFKKAFNLLEGLFIKHSIEVNVLSGSEKIFIKGFANELTEVFLNILKNCIDILTARNVVPKVVHVAFIDMEDKIRITIHDNGGGIEDEYLSKIFDPYFTTKHKSQGVGLGLYISAKNIKEHFSGDLYVKNEEMIVDGKEFIGAKFIIEFNKESNNTL